MRKPLWSLLMIACTVFAVMLMVVWKHAEPPTEVPIATVQRGDVHQVVAISGRIAYAEETFAYAAGSGTVSRICVKPGQRVGAGEELIRLKSDVQEDVMSAYVANWGSMAEGSSTALIEQQLSMDSAVVRAGTACTVRQILVQEDALIAAGTPVLRLSSNQQEIKCMVAAADVSRITPGMWAWLSAEGEPKGFAELLTVGELEADTLTGLAVATVTLRPEQHIELPEGAAIDVEVYLSGSDDVLTLPVEAITERGTVWWVSDGRCTEIPAGIVMTDEMLAWVDLPEGLTVAIGEFTEGQRIMEAKE